MVTSGAGQVQDVYDRTMKQENPSPYDRAVPRHYGADTMQEDYCDHESGEPCSDRCSMKRPSKPFVSCMIVPVIAGALLGGAIGFAIGFAIGLTGGPVGIPAGIVVGTICGVIVGAIGGGIVAYKAQRDFLSPPQLGFAMPYGGPGITVRRDI
ncbi:MAG: hypothetical protein OXF02_01100 [Simkaniaceae bacterium]|nr:hypothetical protein [Simkaniaceae bacterium]